MEISPGDKKLWNAFRSGSEDAFARLFHQFSDPLFYYGCSLSTDRELVKDCIQELLCDLWERGAACPEVDNLKAFLFTGLRRIIFRKLQNKRRYLLSDETGSFPDSDAGSELLSASIETEMIRQENAEASREKLQGAVRALPPRQREAIHLRYFQGLSYEEMAEVMEVKKGTIGRFIAQALDGLRKTMDKILLVLIMLAGMLFG